MDDLMGEAEVHRTIVNLLGLHELNTSIHPDEADKEGSIQEVKTNGESSAHQRKGERSSMQNEVDIVAVVVFSSNLHKDQPLSLKQRIQYDLDVQQELVLLITPNISFDEECMGHAPNMNENAVHMKEVGTNDVFDDAIMDDHMEGGDRPRKLQHIAHALDSFQERMKNQNSTNFAAPKEMQQVPSHHPDLVEPT